jgi:hypothetical protein
LEAELVWGWGAECGASAFYGALSDADFGGDFGGTETLSDEAIDAGFEGGLGTGWAEGELEVATTKGFGDQGGGFVAKRLNQPVGGGEIGATGDIDGAATGDLGEGEGGTGADAVGDFAENTG